MPEKFEKYEKFIPVITGEISLRRDVSLKLVQANVAEKTIEATIDVAAAVRAHAKAEIDINIKVPYLDVSLYEYKKTIWDSGQVNREKVEEFTVSQSYNCDASCSK